MDTEMCANMTQERKDECTKRIPAGRWGLPEDMEGSRSLPGVPLHPTT